MRSSIVVLALFLVGAPAVAAPPDPAVAKAKELFAHAQSLYVLTKYDEALAEYEKAFEAKPLAGLLFNIGQCHRQLGHFAKAAQFYRAFLERQPEARNSGAVHSLIAEMDGKALSASTVAPPARPSDIVVPPEPNIVVIERAPSPLAAPAPLVEVDKPRSEVPIYRRWWLWTGVVAVVVAAVVIGLAVGLSGGTPHGTLSTIDAR